MSNQKKTDNRETVDHKATTKDSLMLGIKTEPCLESPSKPDDRILNKTMQQSSKSCPREYFVTDDDARRYIRHCAVAALLLAVGYVLFIAEFISPLVLFAIVAVTLPRWIINLHELLHIRNDKQINSVIGCLGISPIPLSLFTLSYKEIRQIHLAHHREPATSSDPDSYHIRGNFFLVIFNALTAPEQSFIRFLAVNGFNLQLGLHLLIKLLLLGILVGLGGAKFLWFWLFLRIVYGLGDIVFFRFVHHKQGKYGTFEIKCPDILSRWGERIFGETVIQATVNHDVHHQNSGIAARYLAMARPYIINIASTSN